MGRPKNSKDKKKRKRKTILSGTIERELVQDYENGKSVSVLIKKYNVTKSYISNMFKLRKVPKRINQAIIKKWNKITNLDLINKQISGVYSLYFVNKNNYNDIKLYIGSSIDIKARLQTHYRELKNQSHYSSSLLKYFNNSSYILNYAILEECCEDSVLQKERVYLDLFSPSCLLNSWKNIDEETLRPWLEKAITYDSYAKNYTINETTGCKESNNVHKTGYSRMRVTIGESKDAGQTKHFYKHRVAYWEKYGEYPELIRHKCNNPKCYNADHLEKGSHRDNNLDKRGNFPEIFEKKWVELNGDIIKLSEYFSERWNSNQIIKGAKVSYAIYSWEKKLGLREKYPEILDSNLNRRFSISCRKLARKRCKKLGANR